MRRFLAGVVALFLAATLATPVLAQSGASVRQSGASVTPNSVPYWVTNGVIGDSVTAADSPVTSFGVTSSGSAGFCVNSARAASGAWISLCQGYVSGVPTISVQNNGAASAQPLQFIVNGTTYAFPGSLANITIGTTPVVGGSTGQCLFVSGGVVGQQACTLSAITSLTGDVSATGPGVSTATLATVNANTGTFGSGGVVPVITVNGKGLITSVTTTPAAITVGSTAITSGTTNGLLYANGSVLGNLATLASGVLVTSAGGVPSIATTLPSGLTIPSPTFTGTETFPDSATWTASGISKAAALSVGSATLPSGGNVSISGQYQINGTQIAASNLSNGATGSGAVVLAGSPAISGTWTGSPTFSGNITFSGQLIETGTSAPASAGGNTAIMGTITSPTLTNTGQAFLYNTVVNGAIVEGDGSTNDVSLFNKSGALVVGIPTGSTKLNLPSLSAGTCSAGLGLDSGNNTILISCPGASASVQVGTTNVTSGTNGGCLYNNGGILGNHPCITEAQGRITLTANTPVMTATASAQTTLRYDCYIGGQVPYFDGTQDNIDTIASCEVTDAMVSAASAGQVVSGNVYDVWWVHSGANRICLAMSTSSGGGGGWSADTGGSNTARGTGYSQLDRTTRPYATNKNAISNCFNGATNYGSVSANQATYLGTIYATANGQTSWTFGGQALGGTAAVFGVWNMYNRVQVATNVSDSTTSWTYGTATWEALNAGGTGSGLNNRVTAVRGLDEDGISATISLFANNGSGSNAAIGFGLDTTSTPSTVAASTAGWAASTNGPTVAANYAGLLGAGLHFLQAMQIGSSGSNTTYFGSQAPLVEGMSFNSRM